MFHFTVSFFSNKLDGSPEKSYSQRMALDALQLTRKIALTALAEELYSYWPPSSPEELISRVEDRLLDRLYGNRDFAEECREEE